MVGVVASQGEQKRTEGRERMRREGTSSQVSQVLVWARATGKIREPDTRCMCRRGSLCRPDGAKVDERTKSPAPSSPHTASSDRPYSPLLAPLVGYWRCWARGWDRLLEMKARANAERQHLPFLQRGKTTVPKIRVCYIDNYMPLGICHCTTNNTGSFLHVSDVVILLKNLI